MSISLRKWTVERLPALSELVAARRGLNGVKRGKRFATQQVYQAYVVLLSSHFQGFCRDSHDECATAFVRPVLEGALRSAFHTALVSGRKLDSGNPNPGNIGSDFGRFDLPFWQKVGESDDATDQRRKELDQLNAWRNAIAHQHFDPMRFGNGTLRLAML